MNTEENTTFDRPVGAWIRTVSALMKNEMAEVFEAEGVHPRAFRALKAVAKGTADLPERAVERLTERGWIAATDDGYALTEDGEATVARVGDAITALRERVTGAVSAEELAVTVASLEAMARELGWTEDMKLGRGGHGRHGGRGERGGRCNKGHRGHGGRHSGAHGKQGHDGEHGERHSGLGARAGFGGQPEGFWAGRGGFSERAHRGGFGERHRHDGEPGQGHGEHPGHSHGGRRRGERSFERGFERGFAAGFNA